MGGTKKKFLQGVIQLVHMYTRSVIDVHSMWVFAREFYRDMSDLGISKVLQASHYTEDNVSTTNYTHEKEK